jgi:hypothetical protein
LSGARWALPGAAALGFLVGALLWLGQDHRLETRVFEAGSVFNTSGEGLSLAQRYLRAEPAVVRVLTRPLHRDHVEKNAVVFRVRPTTLPFRRVNAEGTDEDDTETKGKKRAPALAPILTPAEEEWVRGGGRLVLALDHDYGRIDVESKEDPRPAVKVFPLWPRVERLVVAKNILAHPGSPEAHALFVRGLSPVVTRARLGRGDLIVLSCPEVLDNAHLALADHLALLVALAGNGRPVHFDEYVHGQRTETGLVDMLAGFGLGPLLASLGVLALAAFWRARTRLGPADEDYRDARSDAVDLLDSLAQLYDRTLRREEAARLYLESLRHTASLKTGLRERSLEGRMKQLLGAWTLPPATGKADLTAAAFEQAVRSINDGFRRLEEHAHPR